MWIGRCYLCKSLLEVTLALSWKQFVDYCKTFIRTGINWFDYEMLTTFKFLILPLSTLCDLDILETLMIYLSFIIRTQYACITCIKEARKCWKPCIKKYRKTATKSKKKVLDYYAFVADFPNSVSQIILLSEGTRCLKIKYFYNLINFDVNIPHQTAHS